jgi:hypothetical protein
VVSDGVLKSFNTDMISNNRTASHTHEFRNFEAKNRRIELASDGSVTIKGKMDVGTNHVITWQKVPAEIVIEKGRIITVSLDDEKLIIILVTKLYMGQSIRLSDVALRLVLTCKSHLAVLKGILSTMLNDQYHMRLNESLKFYILSSEKPDV